MDRIAMHDSPNGNGEAKNGNGIPYRNQHSKASDSSGAASIEIDVLGIIARRWLTMLASVVLCLAAGVAYCLYTPPTYECSAQILIAPKNAAVSASGNSAQDLSNSFTEDVLATHMMVIQSPKIVRDALEAGGDEQTDRDGLWQLTSLVEKVVDDDEMEVDDYVIENLHVTRGGDGQARDASVLRIAFRHSEPNDCRLVLDAIVASFQEFLNDKYSDVNQEAAQLITKAQGDMNLKLGSLEDEYREFQQNSPVYYDGESNRNLARERYELLETQLSEVTIKHSEVAARLNLVEQTLKRIEETNGSEFQRLALIDSEAITRIGIFVDVINGKALTDHYMAMQLQPMQTEMARVEYETLLQLRMREQLQADMSGESHPSVVAARKMRESAEEYLDRKGNGKSEQDNLFTVQTGLANLLSPEALVDAYVQILRNDLASLTARRSQLLNFRDQASDEASRLIEFELEGAQKRRELDRQIALYDATVERLRDINLAKDFGGYVNELIADPELGEEVWPSKLICLAASLMLGCCLAGGSSILLELMDTKISRTAEIEDLVGSSVLATIPKIEITRKLQRELAAKSPVDPHIVTLHQPGGQLAEAYRGLRTSLLFKVNESHAKVISFTSPMQGDGKTNTCLNLAVSAAGAGKRVLLIDGDIRRPKIGKQLGLKTSKGLTNILSGGERLKSVIVQDFLPNLDVIPTNSSSRQAAELLENDAFRQLLHAARKEYDLILIDSPPLLAVVDPKIIAAAVDGTMLVVRTNPKTRQQLEGVRTALEDVDAEVLGIVVNNSLIVDSRTGGYGYGYYYGKEYSYA